MTPNEKPQDVAATLLRLRQAGLAQAAGTDVASMVNFIQAQIDAYRRIIDDRRAELERRLAALGATGPTDGGA